MNNTTKTKCLPIELINDTASDFKDFLRTVQICTELSEQKTYYEIKLSTARITRNHCVAFRTTTNLGNVIRRYLIQLYNDELERRANDDYIARMELEIERVNADAKEAYLGRFEDNVKVQTK